MKVSRFDSATGTIKLVGDLFRSRIARTEIQDYPTGPELRDPADVFEHESLASLVGVRVQVTHDAGQPTVGYVRAPVRRVLDGEYEFVEAAIEITDAPTRARIDRGELLELSAGYSTEVDPTPGYFKGRRFVGRQRRIRFDHVALLPRDQRARCGEFCRVHFDSQQPKEGSMSCSCNRTDVIHADGSSSQRFDAATESRIDALSRDGGVDAAAVRQHLQQLYTRVPGDAAIENAVQSVRIAQRTRELYG